MTTVAPTAESSLALEALRGPMRAQALQAEDAAVQRVLAALELSHGACTRARERATALVAGARARRGAADARFLSAGVRTRQRGGHRTDVPG